MSARVLVVVAAVLAACSEAPAGEVPEAEGAQLPAVSAELAQTSGQILFQTSCASCHTLQPPPSAAPPMSHIARRYRMAFPDRAEFIDRLTAWVRDPAHEESLMPERAIEHFGLMSAQIVDAGEMAEIAAYIYTLEPGGASMQMGEGGMGHGRMGDEAGGGGMHGAQGGSMRAGMPMEGGRMNHGQQPDDSAQ